MPHHNSLNAWPTFIIRAAWVVGLGLTLHTASAQWTVTFLSNGGATTAECLGGAANGGTIQFVGAIGYPYDFQFQTFPSHAALWNGLTSQPIDLHPVSTTPYSAAFATDGVQQGGNTGYRFDSLNSSNYPRAATWNGSAASYNNTLSFNGFTRSWIYSIANGEQAGAVSPGSYLTVPAIWHGTSESVVLLSTNQQQIGAVYATDGVRQVGFRAANVSSPYHAGIWTGTAASFVDLNPPGMVESVAYGMFGTQQVGYAGPGPEMSYDHAALWTGSANSFVDLHPPTALYSYCKGTCGTLQAGSIGVGPDLMNSRGHAAVWAGSAQSMVDLHSYLPFFYTYSQANGIFTDGTTVYVYGYADSRAVVWSRPVPCPADLGRQGGLQGGDGLLDNNDFVIFINYFFASHPLADVGTQGGQPGHDSLFDNNDFVVYINAFFAGC